MTADPTLLPLQADVPFPAVVDKDAQLKIDYADLGVTTGYIGNFERWGDDRSFMVFVKASSKPCASACDQGIHINVKRGPKGEPLEPVVYDTPVVRERLDAIRAKLAKGEVFLVGASHWLEKAKADAAAGRVPSYWNY